MAEQLDLTQGRVARPGDPGYANANALVQNFLVTVAMLQPSTSEIAAALGAIPERLWGHCTEKAYQEVVEAVRMASLGLWGMRQADAAKAQGGHKS